MGPENKFEFKSSSKSSSKMGSNFVKIKNSNYN